MIDDIVTKGVLEVCDKVDINCFLERTILVTGGAGFIGSWLVDVLIHLGAEVTCLDNLSTGLTRNIDHHFDNQRFRFIRDDVTNFTSYGKYDYVLHLASRASPEEYQKHPIETLLANSLGSHRMLELARKMDSRILYTSTSEVYGDAQVIPTPEDYWGNVNPVGPRSCYDEGKRFGEALFLAYFREYGLDVRIARIFNTCGPRIRATGSYARAVPRFIMQALSGTPITVYGDGSQTRSLCYVSDTVLGLLMLLAAQNARGEIVNIGASKETTILDIASRISTLTKSSSKIVFGPMPIDDPKRRCPDISKARRILNWGPSHALDECLRKTVEWFEERLRKNQSD